MTKIIEVLARIGNRIGKPPGWERVVRLFVPPEKCQAIREIRVIRDGSTFLAQPAVPIGWHVTFFGSYEPEVREIFRAVLQSGGVALDVGANVGWHTLLMARLVGVNGRVLAAEANPSVRARLEANLKLNRLDCVQILPYAIADSERTLEFWGPGADNSRSGDGHVIAATAQNVHESFRVQARPLDAIVAELQVERLDLLKIDVEGYEWPVLKGAQETIARHRPHVIFEYNEEYVARGGGSAHAIYDYFMRHGYALFELGRWRKRPIKKDRWPSSCNVWAMPVSDARGAAC